MLVVSPATYKRLIDEGIIEPNGTVKDPGVAALVDAMDQAEQRHFENVLGQAVREYLMQPGQLVIQKSTGKRLTVKAANSGNAFVLCSWMETNPQGDPIECTSAVHWEDLREPTAEEKTNNPPLATPPIDPAQTVVDEPLEAAHAETHKRRK